MMETDAKMFPEGTNNCEENEKRMAKMMLKIPTKIKETTNQPWLTLGSIFGDTWGGGQWPAQVNIRTRNPLRKPIPLDKHLKL